MQPQPFAAVACVACLLSAAAHADPPTEPTAPASDAAPPPNDAPKIPTPTENSSHPPASPPTDPDNAEIDAALAHDTQTAPTSPATTPVESGPHGGATPAAFLPDIALILDIAFAALSAPPPPETGDHDPKQTGFNLRALELSLGKSVDPYFRLDSNIVFNLDGVELEEAYGTTLSLPWNLQARAGQMLTRFGRMNSTHPHSWDFVDQPLVLGRFFGSEGNRGVGFELSYLTPLPWYLELVASSTDASEAPSFLDGRGHRIKGPLDLQSTLALKQFFELSEDWSLAWGLSVAEGPTALGPEGRAEIAGTDLYLKYRPISTGGVTAIALQAEAMGRRTRLYDTHILDAGGYASLTWRFAERWATGARYDFTSRRSPNDDSAKLVSPEPVAARDSLALTFFPTEFSRLRLQASAAQESTHRRIEKALFLALELVAGSHGAHAF